MEHTTHSRVILGFDSNWTRRQFRASHWPLTSEHTLLVTYSSRKRDKKAAASQKVKSLSRVRLFATPWTVAYEAPPSMGFSRQEYWSGLPFPSPGPLRKATWNAREWHAQLVFSWDEREDSWGHMVTQSSFSFKSRIRLAPILEHTLDRGVSQMSCKPGIQLEWNGLTPELRIQHLR